MKNEMNNVWKNEIRTEKRYEDLQSGEYKVKLRGNNDEESNYFRSDLRNQRLLNNRMKTKGEGKGNGGINYV